MRRHGRAEVRAAVDDLEDAGGENAAGELHPLHDCVGGEGGGFHDDAVARDEGGDDLEVGEDEGEVPGADGADDAEGHVGGDDALVGVFVLDLVGEGVLRVVEALGDAGLDVDVGEDLGLAGFLHEDGGELVGVGGDDVGELDEEGLPLRDRGLRPGGEGRVGGRDGIFEVLGRGDGARPELVLGPGVGDAVRLGAAPQLVVDDVVELGLHFGEVSRVCCCHLSRGVGLARGTRTEDRRRFTHVGLYELNVVVIANRRHLLNTRHPFSLVWFPLTRMAGHAHVATNVGPIRDAE